MAFGKKSGGGSRRGIRNEATIQRRSVAMRYVADAVVELAGIIPTSPEKAVAVGLALQLIEGAVVRLQKRPFTRESDRRRLGVDAPTADPESDAQQHEQD